ncbi:MAG: outer membrane protein assembly factor BamD [Betaproteobacteria bacterium]|nr:outer membrane protein assembly factor BamD [Betaproteobacteria bacterium]
MKQSAALALAAALLIGGVAAPRDAHALFSDDEARRAILDLRVRFEELRTQSQELGRRAQALQSSIQALQSELSETQKVVQTKADGTGQIGVQSDMERLRGELAKARGQIEELINELTLTQKRQRDLNQQVEERISGFKSRIAEVDGRISAVDGLLGSIDSKVGAVDSRLAALDGKLGAFDNRLGAVDSRISTVDGKLGTVDSKISGFDSKISGFDGKISGFDGKISSVESKISSVESKISSVENKIGSVESKLGAFESKLGAVDNRVGAVDNRLVAVEPIPVTVDGVEFRADPAQKRSFDTAIDSFRNGDFRQAAVQLSVMRDRFPDSPYAPSVLFWYASAQYALREFKSAIASYGSFLTAHAKHPRAADARLNLGLSQADAGDRVAARKSLQMVVDQFPESNAAVVAKERLSRLK